MCGIIGYVGKKKAAPLLLEALKKLEYRGYDSCGIACLSGQHQTINIRKGAGTILEVSQAKQFNKLDGTIGIAHTRWATHGGVTDQNAHPFVSCDGKYALVHNGILENYVELKNELIKKGHTFQSETDTEVLVHLIEEKMQGKSRDELLPAIKELTEEAQGAYTFLLLLRDTKEIIAFRKDSPLIIGIGKNEFYASSDITSFLDKTKQAIILENHQLAVLNNTYQIYNVQTLEKIKPNTMTITWDAEQASKAGFPHFMLKEIFEAEEVGKHALEQHAEKLESFLATIKKSKKAFLIGSGTSYHACYFASICFAKIAGQNISPILGSEFKTYQNLIDDKTVLIAVSQSGETADVLEGIKLAKEKGAKVISLVNVMGSTIMRESLQSLTLNAGPEIAVASTKAFIAQVLILVLLAYGLIGKFTEGKKTLRQIVAKMPETLQLSEKIKELAKTTLNKNDLYLIGRGASYPVAMEGELKIKEISYIHADALAGGELKHHTLALIEPGVPCIALVPSDDTKEDMINNIMQIKARGGIIIGIASEEIPEFDYYLPIPPSLHEPILQIPILQLISYHLSVLRGNNPDKPRNLAKSVTVL
ncbi:MAG: glutamine--fructose-6-phosphate transaminase (isomerizing) [Asgard group archaeon]|nr:glutamine--fructose-6-phosphate transaminase (isomerizing) [Asgard group archaeon]